MSVLSRHEQEEAREIMRHALWAEPRSPDLAERWQDVAALARFVAGRLAVAAEEGEA